MNSVQDAEGRVSNFPSPASCGCGQLDVTLKDIVFRHLHRTRGFFPHGLE